MIRSAMQTVSATALALPDGEIWPNLC